MEVATKLTRTRLRSPRPALLLRRRCYPQALMVIKAVRVRLTHEKIYAQDCVDCETKNGMLDLIKREISLIGELSSEQRLRLLEIANKCPVHRTLTSEIRIETWT